MKKTNKIRITTSDAERLENMLTHHKSTETAEVLENEIARAEVVPAKQIPRSVITMNSRVKYKDEATGKVHEVVLVYPKDANINERKVSVLAPVGVALLGLSVGQTISCDVPGGHKRLQIVDVTYQPEAEGKYDQ